MISNEIGGQDDPPLLKNTVDVRDRNSYLVACHLPLLRYGTTASELAVFFGFCGGILGLIHRCVAGKPQ